MRYETLLLEFKETIATLTLNRPERLNAVSEKLASELRLALLEIAQETDVRALILTGTGRAFCAGADLKARSTDTNPKDPEHMIRDLVIPFFALLREVRVPTIAAVNGPCVAVGVSLALSCDFVIAARSAYFLQAFINLGLVPDMGSSWFLPRRIGDARTMQLLMLGDKLPASEAAEWGLINKCVDDGELIPETRALAERLAQGPTQSYLMIRDLARMAWKNDLPAQIELERRYVAAAGATEDAKEAQAAFAEKRAAKFKGK
jgi:2-(1,2-epoxy-1,2-dihydrophenyl)acetyl-CoA isomerase